MCTQYTCLLSCAWEVGGRENLCVLKVISVFCVLKVISVFWRRNKYARSVSRSDFNFIQSGRENAFLPFEYVCQFILFPF